MVSDFLMPELNGLDLYDALVAVAPHLKNRVVFLTGAARDPKVFDRPDSLPIDTSTDPAANSV